MEYRAQPIYVQNANLNSDSGKVALKIFKVVTLLALIWSPYTYNNVAINTLYMELAIAFANSQLQYSRDRICIFIEN